MADWVMMLGIAGGVYLVLWLLERLYVALADWYDGW